MLRVHGGIINRNIVKTFMNVRIFLEKKSAQKIFGNLLPLYFVLDNTFLQDYQETTARTNAFD